MIVVGANGKNQMSGEKPEVDCKNGCSNPKGFEIVRRIAENLLTGKKTSSSGHLIDSRRIPRKRVDGYLRSVELKLQEKNLQLTYCCTRCGHKWYAIDSQETPEAPCRMGCSETNGFWHFYRVVKDFLLVKTLLG